MKCKQAVENCDCFALSSDGRCAALNDTDFGEKRCPFYKSKTQARAEWNEYGEPMCNDGRTPYYR